MHRPRPVRLLATCFLLLIAPLAIAQNYPTKPIRLIVPFPAAGTTDIVGRIMAEYTGKLLGQQIVVDNRPGAGGNLGTELALRAPADGHTLLLCTIGTCAINASIYPNLNFDMTRDFAPVILVGGVSNVLAVSNEVKARDVKELVALAQASPGKLVYGSSGYGSSPHLSAELFKSMAGVEIVHVPYKGSAPAILDLRGGKIQMFFDNAPSILPQVKGGAVRAIATTGPKRTRALPDVPTMEEQGFKGFVISPWWGVLAPAKTPPAVVARLNQAMNQVLANPEVIKRFQDADLEVWGGTSEKLGAMIKSETARWGKLVRERGIKAAE
jgi:tripartite-type tricarboxylate transporter receptor subunit TctC